MRATDISNEIKRMIIRIGELKIEPDDVKENEPLLAGGMGFDSLAVVALIAELEKGFNIIIEDDEIRPEIFLSVNSVGKYVQSKIGQRQ